jgi:hypothetical protein
MEGILPDPLPEQHVAGNGKSRRRNRKRRKGRDDAVQVPLGGANENFEMVNLAVPSNPRVASSSAVGSGKSRHKGKGRAADQVPPGVVSEDDVEMVALVQASTPGAIPSSSGAEPSSQQRPAGPVAVLPRKQVQVKRPGSRGATNGAVTPLEIGFRPIQTTRAPAAGVEVSGRRSRAETRSPLGEKNSRSISLSAVVPIGKSGRGGADACVPPSEQRGQETVGGLSEAPVPLSQARAHWPYQKWNLKKYLEEPTSSRKLFWERACPEKKAEIAAQLSQLREREEVVQEARQEFGAEAFGLRAGQPLRSESRAAYLAELDAEEEGVASSSEARAETVAAAGSQ